ncbi:MAG: phosphotransferase [Candidatus Izemoplasma sp.]|nr:phosphotransferase [Candidatus Izemoplasma sp.]
MNELFLKQLDITDIQELPGFHNDVYQAKHHDKKIVIRVTKINDRRTQRELLAELAFIEMCDNKNIPVGMPYYINNQAIHEHEDYFYVFFGLVEGLAWHQYTHDDTTYYTAGKYLAKIHQVSYESDHLARQHFTEHPDIKLIKDLDPLAKKTLKHTLNSIETWHKTPRNYGIIHGDYVFSNMIYHESKGLTIIDFDDIEYGFYLYDIAVYLFYYLLGVTQVT